MNGLGNILDKPSNSKSGIHMTKTSEEETIPVCHEPRAQHTIHHLLDVTDAYHNSHPLLDYLPSSTAWIPPPPCHLYLDRLVFKFIPEQRLDRITRKDPKILHLTRPSPSLKPRHQMAEKAKILMTKTIHTRGSDGPPHHQRPRSAVSALTLHFFLPLEERTPAMILLLLE